MKGTDDSLPVVHNEPKQQFEIELAPGTRAILSYRQRGKALDLVHTEVPAAWRERGIAGQLAHAALEFARNQRLAIVPSCPFVLDYLRGHPEYLPLVDRGA
jgi:predicted GNAT family acetyltransferase